MIIKEIKKDNVHIRKVYNYYVYISYEKFHVFPSFKDIINFLMKHILLCVPNVNSHDYYSIDRYTCTSYDVKEYHEWLQTISKVKEYYGSN